MKILIVDDERVSRLALTELLAPLGEIQTTTDGKTAVDRFRSAVEDPAPFDLVTLILDCIESGCSDYIVKPVSQARILKKLGRLGIRVPDEVTRKDTKIHSMVMKKIIDRFHKGQIRR